MEPNKTNAMEVDLQANNSIGFEDNARMVTKRDGTKVPYDEAILKTYLQNQIKGLNEEYIDTDVII